MKSWTSFGCGDVRDLERPSLDLAVLSLGSVGIGRSSGNTIVLNISQSLVVEASVAALVSVFSGAVDKLLLG